jgi:hypothetical protein
VSTTADYIQQYMRPEPIDPARSALMLIDMQYATGSRRGALARKHLQTPEGNPDLPTASTGSSGWWCPASSA